MVEAGAGALELFGASLPANTTGPALVRRVLDRAAANKFTVLRTWAHTVTAQYALQVGSLLQAGWQRVGVSLWRQLQAQACRLLHMLMLTRPTSPLLRPPDVPWRVQ